MVNSKQDLDDRAEFLLSSDTKSQKQSRQNQLHWAWMHPSYKSYIPELRLFLMVLLWKHFSVHWSSYHSVHRPAKYPNMNYKNQPSLSEIG